MRASRGLAYLGGVHVGALLWQLAGVALFAAAGFVVWRDRRRGG
jgi:hypothetical protein